MSDDTEEPRDARIRAFTEAAAYLCEAFDRYAEARRVMPKTVLRPLEDLADRAIAAQTAGNGPALKQHLAEIKTMIASIRAAHSAADTAFADARSAIERSGASIMQASPRASRELQ